MRSFPPKDIMISLLLYQPHILWAILPAYVDDESVVLSIHIPVDDHGHRQYPKIESPPFSQPETTVNPPHRFPIKAPHSSATRQAQRLPTKIKCQSPSFMIWEGGRVSQHLCCCPPESRNAGSRHLHLNQVLRPHSKLQLSCPPGQVSSAPAETIASSGL